MKTPTELKSILSRYKTPEEIEKILDIIEDIHVARKGKNMVILGHNYMPPEIYYGISDYTGDSLALSRIAAKTNADIILFNGVYFMAETAKILNPGKKVLISDKTAGCSLAESVNAQILRDFRQENPGIPIVSYINTSAEVKAESDVICTSGNAAIIIDRIDSDTVFFIPDVYLARNAQKQTRKKIMFWNGKCMVHELFSETDISLARKTFPNVQVVAHPECKPEVTAVSDYTGSTSQIEKYIEQYKPGKVLLLTECSMGDNIRGLHPEVEFVSSCQICPYMHRITLEGILKSIKEEIYEVTIDEKIIEKAARALNKMFELGS
ncbi:MAG: quinolinate synthase NadA [Spirochaetia bacterium]|nr:quinolinate synthase NadA [Spirochaetia bacterium]